MKYLLIFFGLVFLLIGFVGILVPGLPTTPFWLLSAWLFVRSSDRLYNWVISNRFCGKHILNYREKKSISFYAKMVSLISMWTMILVSVIFIFEDSLLRIIVISFGIIGTIVLLLIPTLKE